MSSLPVGLETYKPSAAVGQQKVDVMESDLLGVLSVARVCSDIAVAAIRTAREGGAIPYLLWILLAALGLRALNGGWYYTQYPFIAVALVFSIAGGSRLIASIAATRRRPVLLLVTSAVLAAALVYFYVYPAEWRAGWDMNLTRDRGHTLATVEMQPDASAKIDAHLDAHPRFMFMALNLWSVNLLKEGTKRQNVGRFDCLWPLPGILEKETTPKGKQLAEWFATSLAEDLERHKPEVVIVDTSPYQRSFPASFDIIGWLEQHASFAQAWNNYKRVDKSTPARRTCRLTAYDVYYLK